MFACFKFEFVVYVALAFLYVMLNSSQIVESGETPLERPQGNDDNSNNVDTRELSQLRSAVSSYSSQLQSAAGGIQSTEQGKRTRKLSAFMPMRGRRDWQDHLRQQQVSSFQNYPEQYQAYPFATIKNHDLSYLPIEQQMQASLVGDDDIENDDEQVLRLALANEARVANSALVPERFLEQTIRYQQHLANTNNRLRNNKENLPGDQLDISFGIEPKLRRAFYPMRGKRYQS